MESSKEHACDPAAPPDATAPGAPGDADLARRRLRQALDGILPEVTGDELTQTGQIHSGRTDEEYLRDRPPHHG